MEKPEQIQRNLKELFEFQSLAVIATHNEGQPYTSLVAFVATDDLKHIFFVTPKATRKFTNLKNDSRVAVLINSSQNQASDFHKAVSVTIVGDAQEVSGSERVKILKLYLEKHPYLEEFARSPSCALVQVSAKSFYMVKNFQNVMEMHINQ